jgi:hypothetical protein
MISAYQFKSVPPRISSYHLSDFMSKFGISFSDDCDSQCCDFIVDWQIEPELRSCGIKFISIEIMRVQGILRLETGFGNSDKQIDTLVEPWSTFRLESKLAFERDGSVGISHLEIDFRENIITIS